MNRNTPPPDDSWESDAVWKLLDQAPAKSASARFADDTVRAARLAADIKPWWSGIFSPASLAGLAGATAALTFAVISLVGPFSKSTTSVAAIDTEHAVSIQNIAETETLLAAVDQLDDFSDHELVSLVGF